MSEDRKTNEEQSQNTGFGEEFTDPENRNIWVRGLLMILFALFFAVAETLLLVAAVVQFIWMLFAKQPNDAIAGFGEGLGKWLERVALFQSGASEKLPFPWSDWE